MAKHDTFLLRIDPVILRAVKQWAADELRSANGQIEFLLREALNRSGRLTAARDTNGSEVTEDVTDNVSNSAATE